MSTSIETAIQPCAQCGTALLPHWKFCHKCGQAVRRCPDCQLPNRGNAEFCMKCGARLEAAQASAAVTASAASSIAPLDQLPAAPVESPPTAAPDTPTVKPSPFMPTPKSPFMAMPRAVVPPSLPPIGVPVTAASTAEPRLPQTLVQRFFPQPAMGPSSAGSADLMQLVNDIKNDDKRQRVIAIERFRALKPPEAVPHLMKMAEGNLFSDVERRAAAIAALGAVGDRSALPGLLRLKWTIAGLESVICMALAEIADPTALPYLMEKSWKSLELPARAFATVGLAVLRRPEAVPVLIGKVPFEHGVHSDSSSTSSSGSAMPFVLSLTGHSRAAANWSKLEFAGEIAGAVISMFVARKAILQNSYALVDPSVDLSAAVGAPPDLAMMWMLHLKLAALTEIISAVGPDPVKAYRLQCQKPIEHLVAALALLRAGSFDAQALSVLGSASTSKSMHERLLAYEGYLALLRTSYADDALPYVTRGLHDPDTRVRSAVGAAIIYTASVDLWPQAATLARDPSADARMSILPPLALVARSDHQTADLIANLAMTDPDRDVRDRATRITALLLS